MKSGLKTIELIAENFLSIKSAELGSESDLILVVAPNKAGKTHLLMLIYSILWSAWKFGKEKSGKFGDILRSKIKGTLLLKNLDDLRPWNSERFALNVKIDGRIDVLISGPPFDLNFSGNLKNLLETSPVYIQPSGMGLYYKGVYSLKKYYPKWRLIPEAITDFLSDLFIVSGESKVPERFKKILELFEDLFKVRFYIQQERIYVKETKNYIMERAASGLQTLSWIYLAIKYGLVGEVIIIDEPEANLHPEYIYKLSEILVELSKILKVIVATHSDYLLEGLNQRIVRGELEVDVWFGTLEENGSVYRSYRANRENPIDVSPLTDVYLDILRRSFGYGS